MILWFSGTGNSRYIARLLSEKLGEPMREIDPDILSSPLQLPEGTVRVIWVFPVYSWGVPPYVCRIIRKIKIPTLTSSICHHVVMTCGDDTGLTPSMWRKLITARGWSAMSAFSVQMPNNYVSMKGFDIDSPKLTREKLAAAPARVNEVSEELLRSEHDRLPVTDVVSGSFAWVKTRIIYPWFVRYAMSPAPFRCTDDCVSCGKCSRICPLHNVTMSSPTPAANSHPIWGNNCAGCLACYHVCPKHAVQYGKSTIHKGQYLNPYIFMNRI